MLYSLLLTLNSTRENNYELAHPGSIGPHCKFHKNVYISHELWNRK